MVRGIFAASSAEVNSSNCRQFPPRSARASAFFSFPSLSSTCSCSLERFRLYSGTNSLLATSREGRLAGATNSARATTAANACASFAMTRCAGASAVPMAHIPANASSTVALGWSESMTAAIDGANSRLEPMYRIAIVIWRSRFLDWRILRLVITTRYSRSRRSAWIPAATEVLAPTLLRS